MRIVCFHLNQVGDLTFSLPALRSIRDTFPDSSITSVVRPGAKEVLESTGLVDVVLCRPRGVDLSKIGLVRDLAEAKHDLAISFSQSCENAVLAYLSGAPKRIGFVNTTLGRLLTHRVDFARPPSTENNLRLISAVGCEVTKRDYVGLLRATPALLERADRLLAAHGIGLDEPIVAFSSATSARRRIKEWTDEGFVAVGRHLVKQGIRVVMLGTELVPRIIRECPEIVDLSGKTNLGEAVGVLSRCRTLVSVDSGILHLCAATGRKVVGIYGPSSPEVTGPQGEGHVILMSDMDCAPCMRHKCRRDRECMVRLSAEEVIAAVDGILRREENPV